MRGSWVKRAGPRPRSGRLTSGVLAVCVAATAVASAQTESASGTLILNGTPTPLRFAYAAAKPGFFDKGTEDIQILLSDVPLLAAEREDVFALIRLGREDKAHIVEVLIDAQGHPIGGGIFAKVFDGMVSLAGIHVFERRRFDAHAVEGRLQTREPSTFLQVTFEYAADFAAVIPRPPSPAEVAEALASPPAEVARAYLAALRAGDFTSFLQTLSPDVAADYGGLAGAARFADLRAEMPLDAALVDLRRSSGSSAIATIQGHQNGIVIEYTLTVASQNGRWTVGK